jgi:hypothetical protein
MSAFFKNLLANSIVLVAEQDAGTQMPLVTVNPVVFASFPLKLGAQIRTELHSRASCFLHLTPIKIAFDFIRQSRLSCSSESHEAMLALNDITA